MWHGRFNLRMITTEKFNSMMPLILGLNYGHEIKLRRSLMDGSTKRFTLMQTKNKSVVLQLIDMGHHLSTLGSSVNEEYLRFPLRREDCLLEEVLTRAGSSVWGLRFTLAWSVNPELNLYHSYRVCV